MSLALQVKKFINSEHTGAFIEIELPKDIDIPRERVKKTVVKEDARREDIESVPGDAEPAEGAFQSEGQTEEAPAIKGDAETVRFHYMEAGSGEPLILVHTIGQSLYTWRNVFFRLSEHYRVIAVDLLGHGYSDRPRNFDYTISAHSASLINFMDAMGIESAHFIGFSMGSMYVLDLVEKHPERAGKVILISPGGLTPQMPLAVRMLDSSLFGGLASVLYSLRTVENILEECFFDLTSITPEVVQEYYVPASDGEARRSIRRSLNRFYQDDVISRLREVMNGVLILWAADDKWHHIEIGDFFHAALPSSQLAVIRNAGHLVHEEKPEKLITSVMEFIPAVGE
ncbi:MAG: 2-hydroxy-6-oxononadienedioate/2-hydroxy-6-oxononatrienedioate hydrolase [Firmicutes bacterium ADurb.Bin182]|nr:MAG: 2-hydroxy-6-oxononadienedioate/2-hydroxy-6-oxononatrienedioate hydrolase [Firmicutes bacterium ADurb.Bin182]